MLAGLQAVRRRREPRPHQAAPRQPGLDRHRPRPRAAPHPGADERRPAQGGHRGASSSPGRTSSPSTTASRLCEDAPEPVDSLSVIHLGEHLERMTAQDLRVLGDAVPLDVLRAVVDLATEIGREGPRGAAGRHHPRRRRHAEGAEPVAVPELQPVPRVHAGPSATCATATSASRSRRSPSSTGRS